MAVDVIDEQEVVIPEDYAEYTKYRDAGDKPAKPEVEKAPAAGEEETPPSESAAAEEAEAGQIAEDSEPEEEEQQKPDQEEDDEETEGKGKKGTRLSRRMRTLTGTIAELQARLDELQKEPEAEEEVSGEVASPPEKSADKAEKLVRPMLKDYEDTDTESAWDQYEKARDEYEDANQARNIQAALAEQKAKLDFEHAKATADADWSKAASRFPDYNEVVVNDKVKISAAMESVMRMNPETGTALAYYMGQHPEESERIAKATLATNEREWTLALARAGMELGEIRAKLTAPGKKAEEAKPVPPKSPTAAPPPTPKKVTSASKPPTTIRGGVAAPQTDVNDETEAANYKKWKSAREAQLKRK